MKNARIFVSSILLLLASACDGDEPICDAAVLQARLDGASVGETVWLGACAVTGPIEVPPGVKLWGAIRGSVIIAPAGGRAVTLAPSPDASMPTELRSLVVENREGCAGVVAGGSGAIWISGVDIRSDTGVGVAVDGVTALTIVATDVVGGITLENADATVPPLPPFVCGRTLIATHGIVIVDVESAMIASSSVRGFSRFGLLSIRSEIALQLFRVETNLGAGIEVWGGTVGMAYVRVEDTRDGSGAIEAYGVLLGGGARATTWELTVSNGDGYGVFHDDAVATHEDLVVEGNGFAGVWAQNTNGLVLSGEGTLLTGNGFAGVALLDSTGARIEDATIADTVSKLAISGVSTLRAADGVHVSASDAALSGLVLRDNARVGVVLDLAGSTTDDVTLSDITVDAPGAALGAVAQNGMVLSGWDDQVTRLGATIDNDPAYAGTLGIAEGVGPPCLPPLDDLDRRGILDLVGP